jgi:phytoene synthase
MCIEIFGYKHKSAKEFAINLGIALQLTNILRDIKKDSLKGRIYLPQEDLQKFSYGEEDIFNQKYDDRFTALMKYEVERAEKFFDIATENLNLDDKKAMFAARAMQHIYKRLLEKIIEAEYNIYKKNIRVNSFEKVGISLGVWAKYRLVY